MTDSQRAAQEIVNTLLDDGVIREPAIFNAEVADWIARLQAQVRQIIDKHLC